MSKKDGKSDMKEKVRGNYLEWETSERGLVFFAAHSYKVCVWVWWEGKGGNTDSCVYNDWLNPKVLVLAQVFILTFLAYSLFPHPQKRRSKTWVSVFPKALIFILYAHV